MDNIQPGIAPARVFLVEDDSLIRLSITAILKRNGFSVVGEASSGEEAVERIRTARPDVLIMDISLAGELDGIAVAELIHADTPVPVIFLTAMTDQAFMDRAKRTAPYGYLTKPVDPRELVFTIEMALFRREMEQRILASEEKYRSLVQTMNEGLGLVDANGILLEGNPRLAEILGILPEHIRGFSLYSVIHSKDFRPGTEWISSLIRQGKQDEIWLQTADKVNRCILFSPFKNASGNFAFTAMDVTERKHAEEKERLNRKLKELLHMVDHGILSGKPPREILRGTLRKARKDVLRCDLAAFYFIEETRNSAEFFECSAVLPDLEKFAKGITFSDFTQMLPVLRSGACAWVNEKGKGNTSGWSALGKLKGLDTLFCVPVFSGNRLSGTLILGDSREQTFAGEFQEQARMIASEIGVLVAHSMLNQAFHNSRKLNNRILDLIPDSILIVDHEGTVVSFKEGTPSDFPMPRQGDNFVRFLQRHWHPAAQTLRNLIEQATQVMEEGENTCIEISLDQPGKAGKIHIEVRLVFLFNRQLLAIIRDVTMERESKEQVRNAILQTQEDERKRFAGDLHDGLGQILSALYMNIDALRHSRAGAGLPESKAYQNCLNLSQDAIIEARRIAHNLAPSALEREGLTGAIRKMVGQSFQDGGVEIDARISQDVGRFQPYAESCLYRIAQELLVNVIRHSEATQATLTLHADSEHLMLRVEDNGKGFDHDPAAGGLGLRNLRARTSLLGGLLSVDSLPGKGTCVQLQVPLEKIAVNTGTLVAG